MNPSTEDVKQFFFDAMLDGYPSGKKPNSVPDSPGMVQFSYIRGNLRLVDQWLSVSGILWSYGSTTIYFTDDDKVEQPIWIMRYHGYYQPRAIPVLLLALKSAYEQRLFFGGRGISETTLNSLTYINTLSFASTIGDIRHSSGEEKIVDARGNILGYHDFEAHWIARFIP